MLSFRNHKRFDLFRSFFRLQYSAESSILNVVLKLMLILLYKIARTVLFFSRLKTIAKSSKSKVIYSSFTYLVSFLYSWTRWVFSVQTYLSQRYKWAFFLRTKLRFFLCLTFCWSDKELLTRSLWKAVS